MPSNRNVLLKIPIHQLKIMEVQNARVFFDTYNGIILENNQIQKLSFHCIDGKRSKEIFRRYPKHIFESILDEKSVVSISDNKKYILCHNWFNYYHFITETVYKIFAVDALNNNYTFVFPESIFEFQFVVDILTLLEINYLKLPNSTSKIYQFKRLNYISEKPHCEEYDVKILKAIKDYLFNKSVIPNDEKKLFVSRKENDRRSLKNSEDVEKLFEKFGFDVVYPEDLNFKEQLILFSSAKVIAGIHGAGLTNMIFAKNDCKILEIMPVAKTKNGKYGHVSLVYRSMAEALTFDYEILYTEPSTNDFFEGQFLLDLRQLKIKLSNL